VLFALVDSGAPLHDLKTGMNKFPQVMLNVTLADKDKLKNNSAIDAAIAAAEKKLDGRGRVLLRPSGTEPVVRVMVEGEDGVLVESLAAEIAQVVEEAVA
jgi:phosphoglucosamine mutase